MADVPVLVCTAGSIQGRRIPVPDGGLKIGRAPENDLILEGDGVSRFHARLLLDNGSLWLQDAGSRNGVFVNGVRVTGHQALRVEDAMTVGSHEFTVRWDLGDEESGVYPVPKMKVQKKAWWWPFGWRNE
ncbi:MAG: pSer/pThr/pTyr-binding forkhead associated (FHA) protein [Myxococcota bacterium]